MTASPPCFSVDNRWAGTFANALQVGILVTTSDLELEFASDNAKHLFGCDDMAALRTRWSAHRNRIQRALRPSEDVVHLQIPQSAKHEFAVELEVHSISSDDCTGYLVLARNSGSRRAMATVLRAVETFRNFQMRAAGIAHDIRATLQSLSAGVSALANAESSADQQAELRDTLQSAIGRLERMTHDVVPRPAAADELPRPVRLESVVATVTSLAKPRFDADGIALRCEGSEPSALVRASPDSLHRALLNLVNNAREASRTGDVVWVRWARDGADDVELSVADQGAGMSTAAMTRAFDLFFTTKPHGTGLGLHLTRSHVQACGGSLDLVSEPGAGTRATIRLPCFSAN